MYLSRTIKIKNFLNLGYFLNFLHVWINKKSPICRSKLISVCKCYDFAVWIVWRQNDRAIRTFVLCLKFKYDFFKHKHHRSQPVENSPLLGIEATSLGWWRHWIFFQMMLEMMTALKKFLEMVLRFTDQRLNLLVARPPKGEWREYDWKTTH